MQSPEANHHAIHYGKLLLGIFLSGAAAAAFIFSHWGIDLAVKYTHQEHHWGTLAVVWISTGGLVVCFLLVELTGIGLVASECISVWRACLGRRSDADD